MLFAEIQGLDDVKANLLNGIKNGKVAHAQLFFGTEGSANLALALAYATYLNCEDRQENDACGRCAACIKNNKIIHPDLHFIFPVTTSKAVPKDATSALYMKDWRAFVLNNPYGSVVEWGEYIGSENKQPNISADEARGVVKTISMKAFEGEFKVLILWLPEFLNIVAANALLKVLEEPPAKTIFLLVTNNNEKLLTTILSRTQKVMIRSFQENELQQVLVQKLELPEDRAAQIAYLSDGNMNEALRLANEVQENHHELFRNWMRKCFGKSIKDLMELTEEFQKLGREGQKTFFNYGLGMMRECMVYNHAKELLRLRQEEAKFVEGFCKVTNQYKLEFISTQLNQASYHIERNANARIVFLDTSLQISLRLKD